MIKKRGDFELKYKGHFSGNDESIEGVLRMEIMRESYFSIGWFGLFVKLSGV